MAKTGCSVKVELLMNQALITQVKKLSLSLSKSKLKPEFEGTNLIQEQIKESGHFSLVQFVVFCVAGGATPVEDGTIFSANDFIPNI